MAEGKRTSRYDKALMMVGKTFPGYQVHAYYCDHKELPESRMQFNFTADRHLKRIHVELKCQKCQSVSETTETVIQK